MIYRPTPIPEAKAAAIDDHLRATILAERRSPGSCLRASADPAFALAHGRYEAIKKRVAYLQRLRAKLKAQLADSLPNNDGGRADRSGHPADPLVRPPLASSSHLSDEADPHSRPENEVIDPES